MARVDHDQRFKALIREFLREFVRLFFPDWSERFDFDKKIEWLDKEVFLDPPRGETRNLDLVAQVPVRRAVAAARPGEAESWIVLIHIEVEADDRITRLRPRMYDYYKGLRDRYGLPVWSLALYLKVGLDGVGWDKYEEHLWERRVLHFEYPYVGLPRLDGEQYLNGESILGVALAVMMRVSEERRVEVMAQGLRKVEQSGENDARKRMLADFIGAYLDFDEAQRQEFERLVNTEPYRGVKVMAVNWWEEKGEIAALRRVLHRQLEKRFGPLPQPARERIEELPAERLEELTVTVMDARSLKDLGLED